MIFIWKRKGLLVPLAIILGLAIQMVLTTQSTNFYAGSFMSRLFGSLGFIATFLPAGLNYLFTKYFLKNETVKFVTDEEGQQYRLDLKSTFFWISNKTWTIILLVLAVIYAVTALIQIF
ncbi:hypothetical protein ACFQ4L_03805 [Lapidilactobacillus mulanensis]|uniref:DUF3899 domain-containing protein n=1 Tax=Lapidilactobacillus mulanensis TaxID=2485999 RepID=A0ABW4DN35_9LACO|nr:hypothetical protein [Lapidilactobacillus mulanensis]